MELDIELLAEIITDEVFKVIKAQLDNLPAGNAVKNVNTAKNVIKAEKVNTAEKANTAENVNAAEKAEKNVSEKVEGNASQKVAAQPSQKTFEKKVVCLEDLRHLDAQVLELENGSVITPLARDYLLEKKIRLVYK